MLDRLFAIMAKVESGVRAERSAEERQIFDAARDHIYAVFHR
ncbi:hypothetical protein [Sphingomonas sanxanigenens]|uniref:Uncharacterized protein n=1 Tax=Sphingomonas sanxanigenens DSM 19645 = NX02 TaxID=1123269 RepID=W0A5M1_9SPHN|nr:hypothetical protein [Sphingomonas sanxanigenens]AHE52351.1 hypothetical protein NX02_02970 [Sphingomonas sanxanigenens DSM 19645 = NX02]